MTATHLHALSNAIWALEKGKISLSRFGECIEAVLAGEKYDFGPGVLSVPERVRGLLSGAGRDGLSTWQISVALGVDQEKLCSVLSRMRRERKLVLVRPAHGRAGTWKLP